MASSYAGHSEANSSNSTKNRDDKGKPRLGTYAGRLSKANTRTAHCGEMSC